MARSASKAFRDVTDATTVRARWKLREGPARFPELPSLRSLEVPTLRPSYAALLEDVSSRITSLTIDASNTSVCFTPASTAALICLVGPQLRRLDVARSRETFNSSDVDLIVNKFAKLEGLSMGTVAASVVHVGRLACLQELQLSLDAPETIGGADLGPLAALTLLQTLDLRTGSDETVQGADALASLRGLEALTLDGMVLHDMAALAHLSRLTQLSIVYDDRDDISVVGALVNLKRLTLRNRDWRGEWKAIPVSSLVNLEDLNLYDCSFESSAPLAHLTSLRRLSTNEPERSGVPDVSLGTPFHDSATDAAFLSHMPLRVLKCGFRCHQLPSLANMASTLTKAQLRIKYVVDLSPLSCLTSLEGLWVNAPQTTSLQPLAALPLQKLYVADSAVSTVAPLARLKGTLKSLHVHSTRDVHDWQVLVYMGNLVSLVIYNKTIAYDAPAFAAMKSVRFTHREAPDDPDDVSSIGNDGVDSDYQDVSLPFDGTRSR
jgi:hypothetical protein